jgi:hypothetical protein
MTRFNPHLPPGGDETRGARLQKIRARLHIRKDRFAIRSVGTASDLITLGRQQTDTHHSAEGSVVLKAQANFKQWSFN